VLVSHVRRALVVLAGLTILGKAAAEPTKLECVEANEAAQDLRRGGSLRAAHEKLATCTATACPAAVREDCAQRLSDVTAAQPTIVFVAKDATGADLETVRVTLDGAPFADKLDGTALEVDPGEHTFRFELPGARAVVKRLVLHEGEQGRRETVVMRSMLSAAQTATTETPASSLASRWPVYAAFGAGAAGLVVGSVFGALALGTKSTLEAECGPSRTHCPATDVARLNAEAWGADIGFGVALVGAALGTVLLLTSPQAPARGRESTFVPRVGLGSAGFRMSLP
jgi:hypothetical protein